MSDRYPNTGLYIVEGKRSYFADGGKYFLRCTEAHQDQQHLEKGDRTGRSWAIWARAREERPCSTRFQTFYKVMAIVTNNGGSWYLYG